MPRCTLSKELRVLAAWARARGWTFEFTGSLHIRWSHPDVPQPVFSPHSPRSKESNIPRQKMARAYRQATGRELEPIAE